jgi:hypothetical protein
VKGAPGGKRPPRSAERARWWRRHPDKQSTPKDRHHATLLGAGWRVVDTDLVTHALTDTAPPLVACTAIRLVGDRWLAILHPGEDAWPVSVDCVECVRALPPTC